MDKKSIQVPYSSGKNAPAFDVPDGTIDTHCHIFDPVNYPYKPDDVRNQPPATVDCYRLLQKRLGMERCVIVTPSCYGIDNSCTLNAIAQFGKNARAVVVVDETITDDDLRCMNDRGVRGVRFNIVSGDVSALNRMRYIVERIAKYRWSISLWMPADLIVRFEHEFESMPCQLVFDHRGHLPTDKGVHHEAFSYICELMRHNKAYVKLSALYHDSTKENYADTLDVSEAYANADPDHIIWGTDWPHHSEVINRKAIPDDALMLDMLASRIKDATTRRKLFVENAAKLYGFV